MTLEEAITQLADLGYKDPAEFPSELARRHGADWLNAQLIAHGDELVSGIARQWLGRWRRAAALPVLVASRPTKREAILSPIFIPGEGWMPLGECTVAHLKAREQFYVKAAGTMLRWAEWCRACVDEMQSQGVVKFKQLKGPVPQLPEAEAA